MPASFNVNDKFDVKKGFSQVVFGDDAYLMEVELNELQKIIDSKLRITTSSLLTNGFINPQPLSIRAGSLVLPESRIVVDDRVMHIGSEMSITVNSGDTIYLAVWDQRVTYQDTLPEYGNMSGGGVLEDNGIFDPRAGDGAGEETTRRVQTRFQLVKETEDDTKKYLSVATIGTPAQTSTIIDSRLKSTLNVNSSDMEQMFGKEMYQEFKNTEKYTPSMEVVNSPKQSLLDVQSIVGRSLINLMPSIEGSKANTKYLSTSNDSYVTSGSLINNSSNSTVGSSVLRLTKEQNITYVQAIGDRGTRHKVFAGVGECFILLADVIRTSGTESGAKLTAFAEAGVSLSTTVINEYPTAVTNIRTIISLVKIQSAPVHNGIISPVIQFEEGISTFSFDGFRAFRITAAEYDQINADFNGTSITKQSLIYKLASYYPATNNISGVLNPTIIKKGKNLLPPFTRWINTSSMLVNKDTPYSTELASGTTITARVTVPPGDYVFKWEKALAKVRISFLNESGGTIASSNPLISKTDFVSDSVISFNVPEGVALISISINLVDAVADIVSNPFLYRGTNVNEVFVPGEDHSLHFKTELFGTTPENADTIFSKNGKYYKVKKWEKYILDPFKVEMATWTNPTNPKSSEISEINLIGLPSAQSATSFVFRRYDGSYLDTYFDPTYAYAGEDNSYLGPSTLNSTLRFTAHVSETGWGPNYYPTFDDVRAFLAGWKMYTGTPEDFPFNGVDGEKKMWRRISVLAADASKTNGTATDVLPTTPYPGFEPSMILVNLSNYKVEEIEVEGSIVLDAGDNIMNYKTGVVRREKVVPYNSSPNTYDINRYVQSYLKNPAKEITAMYAGESEDLDWITRLVTAIDSNGKATVSKLSSIYNKDVDYFVDYETSYPYATPLVKGVMSVNEASRITSLTEKVTEATAIATETKIRTQDNFRVLSKLIPDTIESEVGALPKPTSMKVAEGSYVVEAKQPSDLDIVVYGNTVDNLLGDYGDFETVDYWQSAGVDAIFSQSNNAGTPFGYGLKSQHISGPIASDAYVFTPATLRLKAGKKYLFIADNTTDGETNANIGLYRGNLNNPALTLSVTESRNPVHFAKYAPTEDMNDVIALLAKRYTNSSATTGYVIFDGAGLYEISDEMYDRIGRNIDSSNIRQYFPHVNGSKSINNVVITKESRNLLPPRAHFSATDSISEEYVVDFSYTSSTPTTAESYELNLIPGETYTVSVEIDQDISSLRWNVATARGRLGTGAIFTVQTATSSVTFTAPLNEAPLYLNLYVGSSGVGKKLFKNMQLVLGSVATPFERNEPQHVILPVTLASMNGVRDRVYRSGMDWYLEKRVSSTLLDGLAASAVSATAISGAWRLTFGASVFPNIRKDSADIKGNKYDNTRIVGNKTGGFYVNASGNLILEIPNSESGWSSVTPSISSIRAFLNGWQASGNNGTDYTSWMSLIDFTTPKVNALVYVGVVKATGWNAYMTLDYLNNVPVNSSITNAEGNITLHNGKNLIKLDSGARIREVNDFNLRAYTDGGLIFVGHTGFPMQFRLGSSIASYINGYKTSRFYVRKKTYPDVAGREYVETVGLNRSSQYEFTYLAYDKHLLTSKIVDAELSYKNDFVGNTIEDNMEVLSRIAQDSVLVKKHEKAINALNDMIPGKTNLLRNSTGILGKNNWNFTYAPGWKSEALTGETGLYRFISNVADDQGVGSTFSYFTSDTIGVPASGEGTYTISADMFNNGSKAELTVAVMDKNSANIATLKSNAGVWEHKSLTFYKPSGVMWIRILCQGAVDGELRAVRRINLHEGSTEQPYDMTGDIVALKEFLIPYDVLPANKSLNFYVDVNTGNDKNPGTSELPFKTYAAAVAAVPKVVDGTVYIQGRAGTHAGFNLSGIKGTGMIIISGAGPSTIIETQVHLTSNSPEITLNNVKLKRTNASANYNLLNVSYNSRPTIISSCTFDGLGHSTSLISCTGGTFVTITGCNWSNCSSYFAAVLSGARVYSTGQSHTAITSGFVVQAGSILHLSSTGQAGSGNSVSSGSLIIGPN